MTQDRRVPASLTVVIALLTVFGPISLDLYLLVTATVLGAAVFVVRSPSAVRPGSSGI